MVMGNKKSKVGAGSLQMDGNVADMMMFGEGRREEEVSGTIEVKCIV